MRGDLMDIQTSSVLRIKILFNFLTGIQTI